MTVEPEPNFEIADLDLLAMLYVLGDPSIDRLAFESKMESTLEAMEAVARAVEIIHGVRDSQVLPQSMGGNSTFLEPAPPPSGRSGWLATTVWPVVAGALAASLLIFLTSWKPDAEPTQRSDWSAIASAWSDVQSTEQPLPDSGAIQDIGVPAFESGDLVLTSFELVDEPESIETDDIPSWLIIAASRVQSSAEESLQ